jgi:hypothetical protein
MGQESGLNNNSSSETSPREAKLLVIHIICAENNRQNFNI